MKRLIFAIMLAFLFAPPSPAQPSVSIKTDAAPREIYIGDPIGYQLNVTVSSDVAFAPMALSTAIGNFDLLAVSSPTMATEKDGKMTAVYRFVLTTYSTGTQTIPALPMRFASVNGSSATAQSEAITINVKSLLAEKGDEGNLRPLKGMFDFKSYLWLWFLLGAVAAAIGVAALSKWWRRSGLTEQEQQGPARPPEELAWEAIHQLEDADLIATGQIKEFYYRLSLILRDYLERRYHLSALDRTTAELLTEFRRQNFPMELTSLCRDFFDNADLVKFAKFTPGEQEVTEDLNRVKQFVNVTTPKKADPEQKEEIPV